VQYRIGEFSKLGGISIKTLRFYDQLGLLRPAAVDVRTQYRFYDSGQLRELATIRALKDLGASLDDIKLALGKTASRQERRKLLDRLRHRAECSRTAAQRTLLWIDGALGELSAGERAVPVVLKQRSSVRVASIRAQVICYADMRQVEQDLRRAVPLAGGLQGVLWHRCAASGSIEGEPFVEISDRAPRRGTYTLTELPSATMAIAYCEPDDLDAERVYGAIDRWIGLRDYRLAGPKREIYLGQLLEIQFPLKPA
jgi:DNA-binding transcriptional MerR regulator